MKDKKCVWIKSKGQKALDLARANMLINNPSMDHSDDSIVTKALEFYNLHKRLDKLDED